jgi:hypothetical protein
MAADHGQMALPSRLKTSDGRTRRVGVEIERAGPQATQLAQCIARLFGGRHEDLTRFESKVVESDLGDFVAELDMAYLKALAEKRSEKIEPESFLENLSADTLTLVAEQFVPWEIVTPPIPIDDLHRLFPLIDELRRLGAKGTRHAAHFAFGVHLNPEPPDTDTTTVERVTHGLCPAVRQRLWRGHPAALLFGGYAGRLAGRR